MVSNIYLMKKKIEIGNEKWNLIFLFTTSNIVCIANFGNLLLIFYKMIQPQYDLKLKGWSVFITSSDKSTYSAKNNNLAFILQVWTSIVVRLVCLSKPEIRKYYQRRSINTIYIPQCFYVFFFILRKDNVNVRSNVEAFGITYLFPFNRLQG